MTLALLFVMSLSGGAGQQSGGVPTPARATLMPGLGRLHHPIATKNVEAQKFFDQGLTLVYGFNHEEAARSFRRAAELDPASPMPHWGIALALGPTINLDVDPEREKGAYEEAQRAKALAVNAPPNERALVDAIVLRYSSDPKADLKALAVRYKDAMRDVSRRYPDDLDARVAWVKGDKTAAVDAWKRGVSAQDTVNYDEPPDWYYPVRESLSTARYLNGRYDEAERVFRKDLERNPRNGRSLFGLWETLLAQKKTDAAAMIERQVTSAWARADVRLKIEEF